MEAGIIIIMAVSYAFWKILPQRAKPWFILGSIAFFIWLIWPSPPEIPRDYRYVPDLFGGYYEEIFQPTGHPAEFNWFALPLLFIPVLYPGLPIFFEMRKWARNRRRRREFEKFLQKENAKNNSP